MISYSDVVANKLIDAKILKTIPSRCDCGEEYVFTDNLQNICCPNRYCHNKIGKRLSKMATMLGVDGLGDTSCVKICKYFKLKSPAQFYIVAQQGLEYNQVAGFKKVCAAFKKAVDSKEIALWEYVKFMSLPGISSNARALFSGYIDIDYFYKQLHLLQVSFVGERLGIQMEADNSVLAVNIYNTLISYENELKTCCKFFNLKKSFGVDLNICITGAVSGYVNKNEFIRHLDAYFGDKINFNQQSSVTSKTNILVADDMDAHSSKYLKASNMNAKAGKEVVKIVNSQDCLSYIRQLYKTL